MRKLLEIEYGDWSALVCHVKAATGLKTGKLAAIADVSPETWWRWETNRQRPKGFEVLERFARGFDLELDDVRWAAAMAEEDVPEGDPRLHGLNPHDPVVETIMADRKITEEWRDKLLERYRRQLVDRAAQDLADVQFWLESQPAQQDSDGGNTRGAA